MTLWVVRRGGGGTKQGTLNRKGKGMRPETGTKFWDFIVANVVKSKKDLRAVISVWFVWYAIAVRRLEVCEMLCENICAGDCLLLYRETVIDRSRLISDPSGTLSPPIGSRSPSCLSITLRYHSPTIGGSRVLQMFTIFRCVKLCSVFLDVGTWIHNMTSWFQFSPCFVGCAFMTRTGLCVVPYRALIVSL